MDSFLRRLATIEAKISEACTSVGRNRNDMTLIAVTKTVPIENIVKAYDAGLRDFGESRLQEALPKMAHLPKDVRWHFIGRLQSNKAKRACEVFDVIHSIESPSQISEMEKAETVIDGLVEVNLAEEQQKAGIFSENLDETVQRLSCCKYVRFRGLMTIGPLVSDPELNRSVFRSLRELGHKTESDWLSMGMSADYDVAIQEGATHVRVGSALFGDRP